MQSDLNLNVRQVGPVGYEKRAQQTCRQSSWRLGTIVEKVKHINLLERNTLGSMEGVEKN